MSGTSFNGLETSAPTGEPGRPRLRVFLLVAAMLAGLLLRAHCLFYPYLWLDEYVTLWAIKEPNYWTMLTRAVHWTTNAPLFVLCYRASNDLVGNCDLGLKLPGLIAGTMAVWGAWWTARRIFCRTDVALAAAWLVALGPQFVHFSQEARPYMIGSLLILLATGCLASWIRTGRRRDLVAMLLLSLAAIGMQLLSGLVLIAFNLAILVTGLRHKWPLRRWTEWTAGQLLTAAGLGFVAIQLPNLTGRRGSLIIDTHLPMPIRQALDSSLWTQAQSMLVVLLIGAGFWLLSRRLPSTTWSTTRTQDWTAACFAGATYLVPTALLTALAALRIVDGWARYYFLFQSGFLLALSWLLVSVFPRYLSWCLTGAVLAGMVSQFNCIGYVPSCRLNGLWKDFPAEEQTIRSRIASDDLVLSRSGLIEANHTAFLSDPEGASYLKCFCEARNGLLSNSHIPLPFSPEKPETQSYLKQIFESTVLRRSGFWLVNVGPTDYDYSQWIETNYGESLRKVEELEFPVFTLSHYVNDRVVDSGQEVGKKGTSDQATATLSEVPCQRFSLD